MSLIHILVANGGFLTQLLDVAQATARNTVPGQAAKLVLGDVQPTAVFGCTVKFDTADDSAGSLRLDHDKPADYSLMAPS